MTIKGYVVYTRTPEGRIVLKSEYPKGRINILAISEDDNEKKEISSNPIRTEEEFWKRMSENSKVLQELSK